MAISGRQQGEHKDQGQGHTICVPNLHLSPWLGAVPQDLIDYLVVCQRGEFYQALAEAWGLPFEPEKAKNRIKFFTFKYVLFGSPRPGHPYWEGIRRRWPTVAYVIEQMKVGDKGTTARACQRIESSLMIGGVVERFRTDHPAVPIQTIHDSVLVPPDAIDLATRTILDVFGGLG